jgi:PEP-CTERM motif
MKRFKQLAPLCSLTSLALLCTVASAPAQTITSANSSVTVNPISQAGMNNWTVDGNNYLAQQWFWLRTGVGPQLSLDNFALTGDTDTGNSLLLSYAGPGFTVGLNIILTGGAPGSGQSVMGETITINNTSTNSLPLSFYQYSHFVLPGVNSVVLSGSLPGTLNDAYQTGNGINVSETDVLPNASEGEANVFPNTLNELNTIPGYVLNGNTTSVGNATWAFEWDRNLAPGGSLSISKTLSLTVPEPSTIALLSVGLAVWAGRRRRS